MTLQTISSSIMNAESNQNEILGDSILQREIQIHLSLTAAKKKKKPLLI